MDENWRNRRGKKVDVYHLNWRFELYTEFMYFADKAMALAKINSWNFWGGGVDNYSITLSQNMVHGKSISIRLLASDDYKYYVSYVDQINPNNVSTQDYEECIGNNMSEAITFLQKFLENNTYIPRDNDIYCFPGGAYDRYFLAKKWAYEELEERKEKVGV